MRTLITICLLFLLIGCGEPTAGETPAGEFALYLLENSTLTAAAAFSQPIDSLRLAVEPLFTANEMKYYIWASHSFQLTDSVQVDYEQFLASSGSTSGVPFVVTVDKDPIYMGTFWWSYSSSMPPRCAVIWAIGSPGQIRLERDAVDRRSDPRIHDALKAAGVLM